MHLDSVTDPNELASVFASPWEMKGKSCLSYLILPHSLLVSTSQTSEVHSLVRVLFTLPGLLLHNLLPQEMCSSPLLSLKSSAESLTLSERSCHTTQNDTACSFASAVFAQCYPCLMYTCLLLLSPMVKPQLHKGRDFVLSICISFAPKTVWHGRAI